MSDFFSSLFKKNDTQPTREVPKFYERKEDDRVELIHKWDLKVSSCDQAIKRYRGEIAELDSQIKVIHEQYAKYKNKESKQATDLRCEGGRLMGEKQKLEARKANEEQKKNTAILTRDNLSSIVDVEEFNDLTKKSTLHIDQAVSKIDLHSAKTSASEARKTNKQANQLTAFIINPYNVDLEEDNTAFAAAFDQLKFGEDEFISEEQVIPVTQNITNKVKPSAQSILDDELF